MSTWLHRRRRKTDAHRGALHTTGQRFCGQRPKGWPRRGNPCPQRGRRRRAASPEPPHDRFDEAPNVPHDRHNNVGERCTSAISPPQYRGFGGHKSEGPLRHISKKGCSSFARPTHLEHTERVDQNDAGRTQTQTCNYFQIGPRVRAQAANTQVHCCLPRGARWQGVEPQLRDVYAANIC